MKLRKEKGATLVEYVLILAVIGVGVLLSLTFLGNSSTEALTEAGASINATSSNTATTAPPGATTTTTTTTAPTTTTIAQDTRPAPTYSIRFNSNTASNLWSYNSSYGTFQNPVSSITQVIHLTPEDWGASGEVIAAGHDATAALPVTSFITELENYGVRVTFGMQTGEAAYQRITATSGAFTSFVSTSPNTPLWVKTVTNFAPGAHTTFYVSDDPVTITPETVNWTEVGSFPMTGSDAASVNSNTVASADVGTYVRLGTLTPTSLSSQRFEGIINDYILTGDVTSVSFSAIDIPASVATAVYPTASSTEIVSGTSWGVSSNTGLIFETN